MVAKWGVGLRVYSSCEKEKKSEKESGSYRDQAVVTVLRGSE